MSNEPSPAAFEALRSKFDVLPRLTARIANAGDGNLDSTSLSPDGSVFAYWGFSSRLVNTSDGKELLDIQGRNKVVSRVSFSPAVGGTNYVATAGDEGVIRIWNLETRKPETTLPHPGTENAMEFSPDGRQLLTAGDDRYVRLWATGTWRALGAYQQPEAVFYLAFNLSGTRFAAGCRGDVVLIWAVDERGVAVRSGR